ncbi:MAG: MmcQ/YjbR family DNA-binding protein [Bryobacteraceae bacterium]
MTADDFRRIALSLPGAEEGSHMGAVDFRVGGRIFATLASVKLGYGNLMLTPEQQAAFVEEMPEVFLPVHGGWGRMGATHLRLAEASEDVMTGALKTAWKHRVDLNAKTKVKSSRATGRSPKPRQPRAKGGT